MKLKESIYLKFRTLRQSITSFIANLKASTSVRQCKMTLVFVGIAIGTFCLLLIIGVVGTHDSDQALQIDSITKPKDVYQVNLDSLKTIPSILIDSFHSVLKEWYSKSSPH